jgi:hypothetical protein
VHEIKTAVANMQKCSNKVNTEAARTLNPIGGKIASSGGYATSGSNISAIPTK